MRNLLRETPKAYAQLHGRCRYCCEFVDPGDLRGRDVLDIGCGFGWFERFAALHAPHRLVGIEPVESDLAAARSVADETRAEYLCAGAFQLPFPALSFDTVCIWDVIEHLPRGSETALFREIGRVLRSDGHLYLSTPCRSFPAVVFDPAYWLIGHRHYTIGRLAALAADGGLQATSSEIDVARMPMHAASSHEGCATSADRVVCGPSARGMTKAGATADKPDEDPPYKDRKFFDSLRLRD